MRLKFGHTPKPKTFSLVSRYQKEINYKGHVGSRISFDKGMFGLRRHQKMSLPWRKFVLIFLFILGLYYYFSM